MAGEGWTICCVCIGFTFTLSLLIFTVLPVITSIPSPFFLGILGSMPALSRITLNGDNIAFNKIKHVTHKEHHHKWNSQ